MFGYLKLDKKSSISMQQHYKKMYCFVCKSLSKHYGLKTRLVLAYDVSFFAIVLNINPQFNSKINCFYNNKEIKKDLQKENSKKIAALNIALMQAKLLDDILDERTIKAKVAYFFFRKNIKKANRDYPMLFELINGGYKEIRQLEKEKATVDIIGAKFSELIINVAIKFFNLKDSNRLSALEYVAKWIYLIDALDDLKEDIKKDRFNPFIDKSTESNFLSNNFNGILNYYLEIKNENTFTPNKKSINDLTVDRIINVSIFQITAKILISLIE